MNSMTSTARRGPLRWLRIAAGALVAVLAFYFLGTRLIRDWHQIPFDRLHFQPLPVIGSFALLLVLHMPLYGYAWRLILHALGAELSVLRATAIMSVTQLGKYAPGKVWFAFGRIAMAKSDGVPEDKCMVSVVVEIGFALLAAVLLLGIAVLLIPRADIPAPVYLLFALAPASLVVVYPPVLNRILHFALVRLKRPVFELRMSYPRILRILGIYFIDWTVQGLGCFLLISAFYPLPLSRLPMLLGGYAVSWMLGFLVLVAPAGLGVREGIYTVVLRSVMPEPVAIISALVTRVWMTCSELLMAGICLPVIARRRKNVPQA